MLRFPVYFLADCSKAGVEKSSDELRQLHSKLMTAPEAVESVWLSVIRFGEFAEQVMPLQDLVDFAIPDLPAFHSEQRRLGDAMFLLKNCICYEVEELTRTARGDYEVQLPTNAANKDYPPLVFVCVGGPVTEISDFKTLVGSLLEAAPNAKVEVFCDRAVYISPLDKLPTNARPPWDSYAIVRDYIAECMEDTYFSESEPQSNVHTPPASRLSPH